MYQAVHLSLYVGHTCLCIDHVKAAGRGEGHGSGIMCIRVRFSGHTSALRVLHMSLPVTTAMWHMPSCLAKPTIAIGNNSDSYKYPHAQRKYQRLGRVATRSSQRPRRNRFRLAHRAYALVVPFERKDHSCHMRHASGQSVTAMMSTIPPTVFSFLGPLHMGFTSTHNAKGAIYVYLLVRLLGTQRM